MKKPLIIVVGPTAAGKTEITIKVAQEINGEVISADSMQIYKHMSIGTAKPKIEELKGIRHYLIDEIEPDQDFNVSIFQKKAFQYIENIHNKNKIPIVAGGTGLYINSLIYPLDFTDGIGNWEFRSKMNKIAEDKGNKYLHDLLNNVDPDSALKIHPNNKKRVIRALEVYEETGKTMTYFRERSQNKESPYNLLIIGLNMERELLYDRINERVDIMIKEGLIQEVKAILEMGYRSNLVSLQGLGYKEIIKYLEGKYTLEEAIYILKRDTRRFAKRQLTWFRRNSTIDWYYVDKYASKDLLVKEIVKDISNKIY